MPGHRLPWYALLIAVAVLLAIVGHDMLHAVQRWLTYVMMAVFGVLTVGAVLSLRMDAVVGAGHFSWAAFLIQLSAAAGYQISYAVYVSDYSRYLPHETPSANVIFWTYLGAAGSALWLMSLGAFLASALPAPDAIGSVQAVGNAVYPGFGTLAVLIAVPSLVGIMAVNCYGAMLTSLSAIDAFRKVTPTLKLRMAGIGVVALTVFAVALAIPASYLASFNTFVLLMLYFLVPWTAVNLMDFYVVRGGHYAIGEIFNPAGIYGRWGGSGLTAYAIGMLAMVPFMTLGFYTGPFAVLLGGADIAFLIGLLVAGSVYVVMCRKLDLEAERRVALRCEGLLEGERE
ncbi:purine-cytosine permease family protein [Serratia ureilytica]|uniref:purine-cytosine permease family protein n=1 Tax=Serratia ureilytica TaxID=300181 RepID=UPI003D020243